MRCQFRKTIDRLLNRGIITKITIVIGLSCVVFLISALIVMTCFYRHLPYCDGVEKNETIWQLYYYFADPGNQMSAHVKGDVNATRWIGLIVSTLGSIFLSGLLISTITSGFERMADKWRTGYSYYKFKGHIVVIGSEQMVYGLVNQLCETTKKNIVVMTSADVEQMRNALWASLKNKKDRHRVVVNYGQRDSETFLKKINVAHANEVYLLGDTSEFDDIESFHDSLNVHCLTLIAKQCKEAGKVERLKCHVLFEYKTTYHVFQYADLSPEVTKYIDFHPFNFYDFWARKVLVAGYSKEDNIKYRPLDYVPITSRDSDKYVHFIIIGMSQMGQAMALQAAHIAHYPNYKKRKTKITFIDCNCRVEMGEFKQKCGELFKVSHSTFIDADAWSDAELNTTIERANRDELEKRFTTEYHIADEYEHLAENRICPEDFIDVEWEFIKGYDHNPVVQYKLRNYVKDDNAIVSVAVCLNITHISLRSAMSLPKAYYEKEIPILVQQRKTSTMVATLNGEGLAKEEKDKLQYRNVKPFGMVTDCYDLHMVSSVEICKRISYVYDYFFNYNGLATSIDVDKTNKLWDNTVISKRWSNIFAAASIPTKMRSIGVNWDINNPKHIEDFTDEQVELLAEIEHNRWNIEELLLGYRPVYKDEDNIIDVDKNKKKEYKQRFIHYDIRPFSGLKTDKSGRKADEYDKIIVKSLPLILNNNIKI